MGKHEDSVGRTFVKIELLMLTEFLHTVVMIQGAMFDVIPSPSIQGLECNVQYRGGIIF